MTNLWLKKNPIMSLWLSGANAVAGRARSVVSAEVSKQQKKLTKDSVQYWTQALQPAAKPKRHR